MIDSAAAAERAEGVVRAVLPKWDYYAYQLKRIGWFPEENGFLFGYGPTRNPDDPGGSLKVGGHIPVLVDPHDGSCRFVSFEEYFELKERYEQ